MHDTPSGSSQLYKPKLSSFDGNPLEWPDWLRMFVVTVHRRNIRDSEQMSNLITRLSGKAKLPISGMCYSGSFYTQAWSLPERRFGPPHLIVDAQLETLRK